MEKDSKKFIAQKMDLEKFSNFVIFQTEKGKVNIDVFFQDETLWLTQKMIAELFEVNVPAISKHFKNIFESEELSEKAVVSKMETTASDGKKYKTKYFSLKAVLSVGYRVNSHRAIEFRKWANLILEEYVVKGFAMDDERLKQVKHFGKDYFDEMLERVREIRLSERRIYQKITDIYALSADYDSRAEITKHFFCYSAKQVAFCNFWENRCGNNLYRSRRKENFYGSKNLEKCTQRKNFKV